MRTRLLLIVFLLWLTGGIAPAEESPTHSDPPVITQEDMEIIKVMEVLDLMDELEDLDLIKDMDLLIEDETYENTD